MKRGSCAAFWTTFVLWTAVQAAQTGPVPPGACASARVRRNWEESERLRLESERRAEEERRRAAAQAALEAGDSLARAGKVEPALERYALGLSHGSAVLESVLREKAVRLALAQPRAPQPPPEAEEALAQAQAGLRAGQPAQALKHARKAAQLAPWHPPAYRAAAEAAEAAGEFPEAMEALRWHQKAAPEEARSAELKQKLAELEVAEEYRLQAEALSGQWRDQNHTAVYDIKVHGRRFELETFPLHKKTLPLRVAGEIQAGAISGVFTIPPQRSGSCDLPEDSGPVRGEVGADGEELTLEMDLTQWETRTRMTGYYDYVCTGVNPRGKKAYTLALRRAASRPKSGARVK